MADHSYDWYDETTTRERINDVMDNVDAIHESFEGEHLTKEYPLKKEDETFKSYRQIYGILMRNHHQILRRHKKKQTANDEKKSRHTTMGKENMKEPVPHDLPPTPFLGHLGEQMGSPYQNRETVRMNRNPEEIHNVKAQDDKGDMDVGWDIMSKDVERFRAMSNTSIPHFTQLETSSSPYLYLLGHPSPATNPMSNKQSNKIEEEFSNITNGAKKEYDNPVRETYDCENFIRKLLHQVIQSSREMKSQQQYGSNLSFSYPVANHDMEDDVDISALTLEQYIALIPDDIKPGIVNPKIGDDIEFEINANFMRELRRKLFAGTNDEDGYNMCGRALRWKNRLQAGTITTWDLLKKEFIWRYCHPFITVKKLEEIHNFKQERDETLYHAWERYNYLLYQYPLHYLNCQQKVHIFYTVLDISTYKILYSNGFIPLMTPTQALESIQVMTDHSHDWYDEPTTRERINDVLDNVDAIYKSFEGGHLTKEYPLKKEDETFKHRRYTKSLEETIIKFAKTQLKNRPRMMKR
ncbi:ribonuclease H-like domain-containing protein [Tanacetum coccineum]